MKRGFCHHCSQSLEFDDKVFRNDTCPKCGSDIFCCLNCAEYDETASNNCKEPQSERISVKDRRNFCDYFDLSTKQTSGRSMDKAEAARKKLEALFRK